MNCEFCQGKCEPLYPVSCGSLTSVMQQCEDCLSCRLDPPFPAEALLNYYANSYFQAADWEVNKSAILAEDYFSKICFYLPPSAGAKSLDIGGGFGHFARHYATTTKTSVDVVEPSEVCRRVMNTEEPVGKTFVALSEIPTSDVYQNVFCFHVIEHLQEFGSLLAQVHRHLLPGGRLFILSPNGASSTFREFGIEWGWTCPEQHYQFLSEQIPTAYFNGFGFQVVVQRGTCPAPIHYPSRWLAMLQRHRAHLMELMSSTRNWNRFALRWWNKCCWMLSQRLRQNLSNRNFCRIERSLAKRGGRSLDEVFFVLEKSDSEIVIAS